VKIFIKYISYINLIFILSFHDIMSELNIKRMFIVQSFTIDYKKIVMKNSSFYLFLIEINFISTFIFIIQLSIESKVFINFYSFVDNKISLISCHIKNIDI